MKKLLTICMLFVSISVFAQEEKADLTIDEKADLLAEQYHNQLGLTSKQFLLFKNELKATLEMRRMIEQRFKGKEKLDQLAKMQANESATMGDILTRIQFELYKKIKPELQPLEVLE